MKKMKVCVYLEGNAILRKSGIGSSARNQMLALEKNGIAVTDDPRDGFDVIDINSVGPKSYFWANASKSIGKKVIIHAHMTGEDFRQSFNMTTMLSPVLKKWLKNFYSIADVIVAPSEYTKSLLLKNYGLGNRIRAVSNGIDMEKYAFSERKRRDFRKKFNVKKDELAVFTVGHVFKRKGVSDFVWLAKRFPNVKFFWAGPIYSKLLVSDRETTRSIQHPPRNMRFLGFYKDVSEVYSGGDIFLFPTYEENQGIAVLEAFSSKTPVILRDIPVYTGWLREGEHCLKFRTRKEMEKKMGLILGDSRLRAKLSQNGYREAQKHTLKKVGAQLKRIYASA